MGVDSRLRYEMRSPAELRLDVTIGAEVPVPSTLTEGAVSSLIRHVLASEGWSGEWHFGIQFVRDPRMQQAHAEFMGIDEPTDIMTFPYEEDSFDLIAGDDEVLEERGGDLMISVDRAEEQAREAGWDTGRELFFLICHGVLHVLGWSDSSDDDRAVMHSRQSELLTSWERPD